MRLSFLREQGVVYIGGRSVGIGPLRVRWGGRQYTVGPLSFLGVMQLGGLLASEGWLPLIVHALPAWPAEILRVLAPILAGQSIRARDLARATDAQLRALAETAIAVNDWPRIVDGMKPRDGEAAADEDAFDIGVAWLARHFGLWPYEIMSKPYCEVQAVSELLRRESGGISRDAEQFVVERTKAIESERERADAKLRSLGIEVDRA